MRHVATLLLIAGCGFSAQEVSRPSDAGATDVPPPPMPDAMTGSDAHPCTAGFVDVCSQSPSVALDISTARTLDTDSDPLCKAVNQGGRTLCLIYASEVAITASGSLAVTGGRPLALVSATTMQIDGLIDVGSHGGQVGPAADDASCMSGKAPDVDQGGGGGGAGASFTLPGGNGGNGDKDTSTNIDGVGSGGVHGATVSVTPLVALRGGCRGQKGGDGGPGNGNGGAGGHSGGALYLGALQSLSVAGNLRATGAGGVGGAVQAGGGGGGAGGLVVIESPSITISGQVSANGGGGGQGGGRLIFMNGTTKDFSGVSGADGDLGTTAAAGGFGADNNDPVFSTGGTGGAGTMAAGGGTDSAVGGGGGGGVAGAIRLLGGTPTLTGSTISPPPT